MRRLLFLVALWFAISASSAREAMARVSAGELLQPVIAEIDVRLAALAGATAPADVKLRTAIQAARATLASDLGNIDDAAALAALKKVSGKIAKAFPSDPTFGPLMKTALDGFAAVISSLRTNLDTRVNALADPALAAKARKGLTKLDGLLADAAAAVADPKARAKSLGSALARAVLVTDLLAKCPGHPGPFGHGQVIALNGTDLFKPRFASAELFRDAGGAPAFIDIDGYHFPYEKGAVALSILGPVAAMQYSFAADNLIGSYQKDGVTFFMESGTLTLDEFDPVARRAVGRFEFTARDLGSDTRVTLTSGTFTVCDFKLSAIAKR